MPWMNETLCRPPWGGGLSTFCICKTVCTKYWVTREVDYGNLLAHIFLDLLHPENRGGIAFRSPWKLHGTMWLVLANKLWAEVALNCLCEDLPRALFPCGMATNLFKVVAGLSSRVPGELQGGEWPLQTHGRTMLWANNKLILLIPLHYNSSWLIQVRMADRRQTGIRPSSRFLWSHW